MEGSTPGSLSTDKKKSTIRQTAFVFLFAAAYLIWISLLFVGHLVLYEYELTPSPLANSKRVFPQSSDVQLAHGRQNIVMFLHPSCPCSEASVDEFHELMRAGEKDSVGTVVFYMPPEKEPEWSLAPIVQRVKRIRNVTIEYDTDGSRAETFGVTTSGHVLIYDGRGILQFTGGITGSRGHTGENHYFDLAKQCILARRAKYTTTPVFGCALRAVL
ncbi:MAG: RedB protein [Candidatus Melainabacteria bacterium]|nr:MAG: RedB protein [Candidatus Melainabacteria bacterium]